jgi:hypothetical protein
MECFWDEERPRQWNLLRNQVSSMLSRQRQNSNPRCKKNKCYRMQTRRHDIQKIMNRNCTKLNCKSLPTTVGKNEKQKLKKLFDNHHFCFLILNS